MLFSSITFLYVFLPLMLLLYYIVPQRLGNIVLLIGSLLFYFFGEPVCVLLLIVSSLSDWWHSLYIEKHRGQRKARVALFSSLVINLALLGYFKYTDFLIGSINYIFGAEIPLLGITLPIGISFFTFQTMSYTIDVYREKVQAQRNFTTFATFVCLFPQLVAGPIVRYSDIALELQHRTVNMAQVATGIRRFTCGLAKKVLIANAMGEFCTAFRSVDDKSLLFYWLYAVAFSLQIYFDFSGYSDMAIGLGRMFGFHFPENFNYPYISRSITEFWRRWHMTLGGWFRDYVYLPLGGNRTEKRWKWIKNVALVWLLTGLWHGAAWNFVLWGALFGVLIIFERLWLGKYLERMGSIWPHVYVMFLIVVSLVIFNGDGLSGAAADLMGMFGQTDIPVITAVTLYYLKSYAVLLVVAIIGTTPLLKWVYERIVNQKVLVILEPLTVIGLLCVSTAYLVDGSYNPFLYFRF